MAGPVDQASRIIGLLTPRERECLQLAAAHMNSKEIGRQLGITPKTVDTHMEKACKRLGVANRRAAVRMVWPSETAGFLDAAAASPPTAPAPAALAPTVQAPAAPVAPAPGIETGLRPPWGARNTMKIATRLAWIFAIAVGTAMAFGSVLAGLHALKDLV